MYSRAVLEQIDQAISRGTGFVTLYDLDGNPFENDVSSELFEVTEIPLPEDNIRCNKNMLALTDLSQLFLRSSRAIRYASYQSIAESDYPFEYKTPVQLDNHKWVAVHKTYDEIKAAHEHWQGLWETSQAEELRTRILSMPKSVAIHKIVCFGLGSFSRPTPDCCKCSHLQTAAIQTLVSAFRAKNLRDHPEEPEQEIKCYAQDPQYTTNDEKLLLQLGVVSIRDPKGFLEVDEHTLIYSAYPDVPILQIIADVQWPAALICNKIITEEEELANIKGRTCRYTNEPYKLSNIADPPSSRKCETVKHCHEAPFPNNKHIGELVLYLRPA